MFTKRFIRSILPLTSKLFKANSVEISHGPVRHLFSFDATIAYLPIAVSRRLYTQEANPETLIADYQYVKKATKNNNILLVDVREPDEVKEHGKIPNSINIPLSSVPTVLNTMPEKEFEQVYNRAKPNTTTEIIFYCMIGKRSAKAQQSAIDLGYKNTRNYMGSWTDWKSNE